MEWVMANGKLRMEDGDAVRLGILNPTIVFAFPLAKRGEWIKPLAFRSIPFCSYLFSFSLTLSIRS